MRKTILPHTSRYFPMKGSLRALLLMTALLLCLLTSHAESWQMGARPFPFFYQLYSNEIFDIHQDREGYVWIGTTFGLERYDGYRLRTFRRDYIHPSRLTSNSTIYMADNSHYLWVGTDCGVTLYDKRTWQTHCLSDKRIDGHVANDIAADPKTDEVWVACGNHVYRCSPDASIVSGYELIKGAREDGFHQLYIDQKRHVWALSQKGLFVFDSRRDRFVKYPDMPDGTTPYTMLQDRGGNYWIGTWGGGLFLFHPEVRTSQCYEHKKLKTSDGRDETVVYSIAQDDAEGLIWLLTYNELHAYRYSYGELVSVDISRIIDPHKMFTKIVKDREGNLWLGSYDMGYTISFSRSGITTYRLAEINTLLHHDANLTALCTIGNTLWLGQDRYGLLSYDLITGKVSPYGSLGLNEVSYLMPSHRGGLWAVARYGSRVSRIGGGRAMPRIVEDIQLRSLIDNPGEVMSISEDSSGNLWILTTSSLYVQRPGSAALTVGGSAIPRFDAVTAAGKDLAWAASGHEIMLLKYDGHDIGIVRHSVVPSLTGDERVKLMCQDNRGKLWLFTSLCQFLTGGDGRQGWTNVKGSRSSDGVVLALFPVGNNVWLMTNKMLHSIDVENKSAMDYAANEVRIGVAAFRGRAICSDGGGGIFAGGHGGVVHISARQNEEADYIGLGFRVTDVLVGDSSVMFDNPYPQSHEGDIYIPSGCRNITICFSSLRYAPHAVRRVQYKLEDVDPEWTVANDNTCQSFYSSLPKGRHKFMVRWQQVNGTWSEAKILANITRLPAWYETAVAFAVYVMLTILLIFFIIKTIMMRANRTALRHYHSQKRVDMLIEKSDSSKDETNNMESKADAFSDLSEGDKKFVAEMMSFINRHLDDTDYGQEQLSRDMLMSRSTLYRRIKAISGLSPIELICNVKMRKAKEMLAEHKLSVSEIAYALGFSNPKYFTKCFKDEIGMTPTEYQKM